MYNDYFGFKESPFSIAPDPRYLYLSDQHREALAHLIYGVGDHGGFILLTGEVGTGKTTVCRCLLQQLPDNVDVAFIVNPRQNSIELLQSICHELHIPVEADDSGRQLVDQLNRFLLQNHALGRNTTLIIDEAQNLSIDVLEQLRLLTNLETNDKKLLQLLLLGQPELNSILANPELRQLSQRITARYHLSPLNITEVEDYISHRLFVAGCREPLFLPAAIKHIYKASQGIPRLINVICDRSLLGAYAIAEHHISPAIVDKARKELQPVPRKRQLQNQYDEMPVSPPSSIVSRRDLIVFFSAIFVLALSLAVYFSLGQNQVVKSSASASASNNDFSDAITVDINNIATQLGFDASTGFETLLDLWELPAEPVEALNTDLCQRYPLPDTHSCYLYDKDFDGLIAFNRPLLMQLGNDFYVLVGIENNQAIFEAKNDLIKLPLADVKAKWKEKAWWIADISPRVHLPLLPGAQGEQAEWLRRTLYSIYSMPIEKTLLKAEVLENPQWLRQDGSYSYLYSAFQYLQPNDQSVFDEKLTELVKRFQGENNLATNGIVDMKTLLRLIDRAGNSQMLQQSKNIQTAKTNIARAAAE